MELDEDSKPLTAFTVGPLGFCEWERMPLGLTNAPATFQQLMEACLRELHCNGALSTWMTSSFSQKHTKNKLPD